MRIFRQSHRLRVFLLESLFLSLSLGRACASPVQEFKLRFKASYAEAISLVPKYRETLLDRFEGNEELTALGISMIFPEMVKFLHLGRLFEAQKKGEVGGEPVSSELAETIALPFSPFLLKPEGMQFLDEQLPHELKEKFGFPKNDSRTFEVQMDYLAAFILFLKEKFPDLGGRPRESVLFLASAYYIGSWKARGEIDSVIRDFSFPLGMKGSRNRFSYPEVALLFFLEDAGLLGNPDPLPPSSEYWYGLEDSDVSAALASLSSLGLRDDWIRETESILVEAKTGYVPPGIDPGELKKEYICAKAVNRSFHAIFGGGGDLDEERGVYGDAWQIGKNVKGMGGRLIPWTIDSEASLMPGDIIGIRYSLSIFNSIRKPVDYSHVALVLAVPQGGSPIILHCWKLPEYLAASKDIWPLRVEKLERFLQDFEGLFSVKEIIRPVNIHRNLDSAVFD